MSPSTDSALASLIPFNQTYFSQMFKDTRPEQYMQQLPFCQYQGVETFTQLQSLEPEIVNLKQRLFNICRFLTTLQADWMEPRPYINNNYDDQLRQVEDLVYQLLENMNHSKFWQRLSAQNVEKQFAEEYFSVLAKSKLTQAQFETLFDQNITGIGTIDANFRMVLETSQASDHRLFNSKFLAILGIEQSTV